MIIQIPRSTTLPRDVAAHMQDEKKQTTESLYSRSATPLRPCNSTTATPPSVPSTNWPPCYANLVSSPLTPLRFSFCTAQPPDRPISHDHISDTVQAHLVRVPPTLGKGKDADASTLLHHLATHMDPPHRPPSLPALVHLSTGKKQKTIRKK